MKCFFPILLTSILLAACTDQDSNTNSDYSSAKVVENASPELGNNAWRVASEPELVFGTEEGDENLQFYRVFSVIQLNNGNIVVSNSGTHELRFFDPNGNFIKSTGQNGRGPGDFGDWSSMQLYKSSDDAFIVNDNSNDRVQIFSNEGELITVNTMEKIENADNPSITNVFSDNSWLVWSVIGSAALTGNPGEIIQHDYGFHRLLPDWTYDKMLFKIPARPRFVNEYQGVPNYPFIPLTADPVYVTDSSNGVLFTKGIEPSITRVDTTGSYTHLFKWDLPRTKTDSIWERYEQEYYLDPLNTNPDRKAQYEHFLSEDLPIPENTPAISELEIDAEGNIWSKRFELPWDETEVWDVLSSNGNWLTSVKIPQGFTLTEIGSNYLLGYTHRNGFPEIAKFPLLKDS